MDIGRTMLLNSKARHRLDAGTFGMNSTLWRKKNNKIFY